MNYLALCQRLRLEAVDSGTGPVTVIGQTGQLGRFVEWIEAAYEDVQDEHETWRFLRTDFDFPTIVDIPEYTPAAVAIADHANWIKESIRIYSAVTDETFLEYYPWDEFRDTYVYGSHRTQTGRPSAITVKPDNSLRLWQLPNAIFTVNGEYYKVPDVMTADADIPILPARFHMILVWKALMYYGVFAGAEEKYTHGANEYTRMLRKLEKDQLDDVLYGEPLA